MLVLLVAAAARGASCPNIYGTKWAPITTNGRVSTPGPTTLVSGGTDGGAGDCCDAAGGKPFLVKALSNGSFECTVWSRSWWDPDLAALFPDYLVRLGEEEGEFYFANATIASTHNYWYYFKEDKITAHAPLTTQPCPAGPRAVEGVAPASLIIDQTWQRSHSDCCFYAPVYYTPEGFSRSYYVAEEAPEPPADPWSRVRCTYYEGPFTSTIAGNGTLYVFDDSIDLGALAVISPAVVTDFMAADSNSDNKLTRAELDAAAGSNAAEMMAAGGGGALGLTEFNAVYPLYKGGGGDRGGASCHERAWMGGFWGLVGVVLVVGVCAGLYRRSQREKVEGGSFL